MPSKPSDMSVEEVGNVLTLHMPELSEWQANIANCNYVPNKGTEPNRFHRWMHKLAFGIVWSKRGSLGQ